MGARPYAHKVLARFQHELTAYQRQLYDKLVLTMSPWRAIAEVRQLALLVDQHAPTLKLRDRTRPPAKYRYAYVKRGYRYVKMEAAPPRASVPDVCDDCGLPFPGISTFGNRCWECRSS